MGFAFAHKKASSREAAEQLQAVEAMATNSDVYAVVDKSKKRKNHSPAEKELAEEPVSPIYDMATTDMDYKPAPEKNEGLCASIPEKTNLQQEVELENTNLSNKAEPKNVVVQTQKKASVYKSLACIFPTIIAAIAILICIISIAYFSAEISELKTRNTPTQEVNFALAGSQNISVLEYRVEQLLAGVLAELPASSCAALLPTTPSGYYWVSASNGSAVHVYCDMTRSCGGVTGGWVRVGYLDMTNSVPVASQSIVTPIYAHVEGQTHQLVVGL